MNGPGARERSLATAGLALRLRNRDYLDTEIGEVTETPPHIGGSLERHGPGCGEGNDNVLRTIPSLGGQDVAALSEAGVI